MEKKVKEYYDKNTRWFLRFGKINQTGSIHQALWAEGIDNLEAAINHVHHLILEQFPASSAQVIDLGCGVGSSLVYLARHSSKEIKFTGITISRLQVQMAHQRIQKAGLDQRIQVLEASFLDLPDTLPLMNLAFAIEAFVHATDAQRFFQEAKKILPSGSRLILIDDFLTEQARIDPKAPPVIDRFKSGWVLSSLLSVPNVLSLAQDAGFHLLEDHNLSSYLDLNRQRDQFLHYLVKYFRLVFSWSSYLRSMTGGDARWESLKKGWVEYHMIVLKAGP